MATNCEFRKKDGSRFRVNAQPAVANTTEISELPVKDSEFP